MSNQQVSDEVKKEMEYRSDEYESVPVPQDYFQPNTIYRGDCLDVLKRFPDGSVDLIYLDPPFDSERDRIWDEASEKVGFKDRWEGRVESYINYMKERLVECRRVLKDTGNIFVHCDFHVNAHLRLAMDRVFGSFNFRNEIIWGYTGPSGSSKNLRNLPRKHDMILRYSKTDVYFSDLESVRMSYKKNPDGSGGGYNTQSAGSSSIWTKGTEKFSALSEPEKQKLRDRGKIPEDYWSDPDDYWSTPTSSPDYSDYWTDIPSGGQISRKERVDIDGKKIFWPTQKPLKLLMRIIVGFSKEGDLVLDPFCGGGTTLVAAAIVKPKRMWIGIDYAATAVNVTAKRLQKFGVLNPQVAGMDVTINELKSIEPFDFQNWVLKTLGGRVSSRLSGDKGIDGYDASGVPVQVKQGNVGDPVVIKFEGDIHRQPSKPNKGIIVGFDFASGAKAEVARAKREDDVHIELRKVEDLLKENKSLVNLRSWKKMRTLLT